MIKALDALNQLKTGNAEFLAAVRKSSAVASIPMPDASAMWGEQRPFAIILSCSDSRVPAEVIFNQGFGSLFIVRVAGNIAGPSQVGSVEFAVETFECPLVVVMGHSNCGAIAATINLLETTDVAIPKNILPIVEQTSPAIEPLMQTSMAAADKSALMEQAVRANVKHTVDQLKAGSEVIREKLANNELMLIGAEYALETGVVSFYEDQCS